MPDITVSATIHSFMQSANAAAARSALGLVIGTDVLAPNGSLVLATGLPVSTGISGLGTGAATALAVNTGSAGAFVVNGGALGTPSSGTLTNCTGLPVSGITASTSAALGVGSLEIGHASDTTLTRVSAGVAAIEGKNIALIDLSTSSSPVVNFGGSNGGTLRLEAALNGGNAVGWAISPNATSFHTNGTGTILARIADQYVSNPGLTVGYDNGSFALAISTANCATARTNANSQTWYRDAAGVWQCGIDHATTPTDQTIKAHDVTTGTGAALTIAGGKGSTAGGAVVLATSATTGAPVACVTVKASGVVNIANLPTSSAGLSTGDLWNNSGVLTVA